MTDMVLPGRTGQQLGQDLRQHSPEIVVLVTSGYGNPEYETEAPESRTYFLAKPYSRRALVEKLRRFLQRWRCGGWRRKPASEVTAPFFGTLKLCNLETFSFAPLWTL